MQGVGFRPTVFIYAQKHNLTGWVLNSASGVQIELHGSSTNIQEFLTELKEHPPKLARIDFFEVKPTAEKDYKSFEILESRDRTTEFLPVSPDLAICSECQQELFNPTDRRYRYPFINCVNCGPRFTIVERIPYDRPNTSMDSFPLCPDCAREYQDPSDRRFHAQPVACPVCGPKVWLERLNAPIIEGKAAIQTARDVLKNGQILALKGIGGFHLACDAANPKAVELLRQRKHRTGKPFALMAFDLNTLQHYAQLSLFEYTLILSPQAPIVLLTPTKEGEKLSKIVAPDQPRLGFMLPYSPLHLLLMEPAAGFPDVLVMTSANLSEEPIAHTNEDALTRLSGIADAFLLHNREILTRMDDSVVADWREHPLFFRRARGFAPGPLTMPLTGKPVFAAGTELKNTFCLTRESYAFPSHHIGDLENLETLRAYSEALAHYKSIYRIDPEVVVCDLHPDYMATRFAEAYSRQNKLPLIKVQHHHAHIASCMGENGCSEDESVIGLAFDGTGLGTDGTIWGGEVLIANYAGFKRHLHLEPVPIPGGEASIRKPARMALSYLHLAGIDPKANNLPPLRFLECAEADAVSHLIQSGFNSPITSSMGRLFDAVSSILGLCHQISYEAQAAVLLEAAADPSEDGGYEPEIHGAEIRLGGLIRLIVQDLQAGLPLSRISGKFHASIARLSLNCAQLLRQERNINTVALSGGVWQNMLLLDKTVTLLNQHGFRVLTHRSLPPNDGGVSFGQALIAARQSQERG